MFPTGFPKWLRLTRAGQDVRAHNAAVMEAMRAQAASDGPPPSDKGERPRRRPGPPGAMRIMRTLQTARRIINTYAHWESQIEILDVIQGPSLESGENAALSGSGSILNRSEGATAASSSSTKSASGRSVSSSGNASAKRTSQASTATAESTSESAAPESALGVVTSIKS